MRIFIDATTLTPFRSGTGMYANHLLHGLTNIIPAQDLTAALYPGSETVPERFNVVTRNTSAHQLINFKLFGNRLRVDADVSFFPNYFMPFGWEVRSAVTIHDVSFVTHPQYYSRSFALWYKTRIQHSVLKAHTILTVSESSAEQIHHKLGVDRSRIVVHQPIWVEKKDTLSSQNRQKTLVYLGNMEPKKNILRLIQAFRLSKLYEYKLVLIGKLHANNSWSKKFIKMVQETPGVTWKGYLSAYEVEQIVGSASGLINVSHIEGFGLSQLMAMALGTPCLISNDPALVEISCNQSLVTNPLDVQEIAQKMVELTQYDIDRSRNHAKEVQNCYSNKRYDEALGQIIDRLAPTPAYVFPGYDRRELDLEEGIMAVSSYAAVFKSPISLSKMLLAFPIKINDTRVLFEKVRAIHELLPNEFSLQNNLFQNTVNGTVSKSESHLDHAKIRKQHHSLLRILGTLPCIRAIYFSGGTAHQSGIHDKPDLDLFIVSSKNCVWITFVLVRLISIIMNKNNSFCSNYLVDEGAQCITWQRDFYTAFQLLFLKQVFRKRGTRHIRSHNIWIREFFPNLPDWDASGYPTDLKIQDDQEKSWFEPMFWLNMAVMTFFSRRWKKQHKTNLNGGMMWDAFRIKLHIQDHRDHIYRSYKDIFSHTMALFKGS